LGPVTVKTLGQTIQSLVDRPFFPLRKTTVAVEHPVLAFNRPQFRPGIVGIRPVDPARLLRRTNIFAQPADPGRNVGGHLVHIILTIAGLIIGVVTVVVIPRRHPTSPRVIIAIGLACPPTTIGVVITRLFDAAPAAIGFIGIAIVTSDPAPARVVATTRRTSDPAAVGVVVTGRGSTYPAAVTVIITRRCCWDPMSVTVGITAAVGIAVRGDPAAIVIIAVRLAVDPLAVPVVITARFGAVDASGMPAAILVVITIGTAAIGTVGFGNLVADNGTDNAADDRALRR